MKHHCILYTQKLKYHGIVLKWYDSYTQHCTDYPAVPADSIKSQGSRPAKLIYSWISICTSLLEHALSMITASSSQHSPEVTTRSPTASSTLTPPNSGLHPLSTLPPQSAASTMARDDSPPSTAGQEPKEEAVQGVDTCTATKEQDTQ